MSTPIAFSPSLAFDVMIICQNYFRPDPILKYCVATNSYKKEAWHETMLRIASWFTLLMPLAIGLTLYIAHRLAHQAIQERITYWSGKGLDGTDLIREPITTYSNAKLKKVLIYALQNSDVPKTPFENIFLHPCGWGKSTLSFGSDTYFKADEIPDPNLKTLHIFHQFLKANEEDRNKYSSLQEWIGICSLENKVQHIVNDPTGPQMGNIKNTNRLAHGMFYKKVDELCQWPFGKLPDSLKILLATGKKGTDYEQTFKSEKI